VLEASDSVGDTVQLVIGPGYSAVVPVTIAPAPEPADTLAGDNQTLAAEPGPTPTAGC
jgi:hypothetical protein